MAVCILLAAALLPLCLAVHADFSHIHKNCIARCPSQVGKHFPLHRLIISILIVINE